MEHKEQVRLAKALLAELEAKKATRDESGPWKFDIDSRMGEAAQMREREEVLRTQPTLLAFTSSLREKNTFHTLELTGLSILLTRDEEGNVHAFYNTCIHRGAKLVDASCGEAARFTCPYHGWTYDVSGRLKGVPLSDCFPAQAAEESGLTELPVIEANGLIWGMLTPHADSTKLDQFVSALPPEFETFEAANYGLFLRQSRTWRFNWKLGVDTFLENYHFNVLHRNTVAGRIIGNISINDDFGTMRRSVLARDTLAELRDQDESTWDVLPRVIFTYFIYPNTIFFFFGDRFETWRMEPGEDWKTCKIEYTLYAPPLSQLSEDESAEREQYFNTQAAGAQKIVEIEDFPVAEGIQLAMENGQISTMLYGKNEPNLALFYRRLSEEHD